MKITKFFARLCAAAVGFVGCETAKNQVNPEPTPEVKGSITLEADKTTVELGESVTFTATMKDAETGETTDVTSFVSIYDSELNKISNPWTPSASGGYTFNATYGAESSNYVKISVLAQMPEIPADPQPANTKFNHRGLFIDNTGVNCGYCPSVVDVFRSLAQTDAHQHYNEVQVHAGGYANGDPANSQAANEVNKFFSPQGYPDVRLNFYTGEPQSRSVQGFTNILMSYIKKDGADAGISMAIEGDNTMVYCAAQVKAAKAQEYKVVAWLLESGIYSPNQAGATKDHHKIYDYALRNISGEYSKANISGESIGVLAEGETHDCTFELKVVNSKWKYENMGVLVIVSAKDAQGRWEVANTAYCSLNDGQKTFEYIQ